MIARMIYRGASSETIVAKGNRLSNALISNSRSCAIGTSCALTKVGDMCSKWREKFSAMNVPEPRQSVESIVAHVLNRKTLFGIEYSVELNDKQKETVDQLCMKRLERMPVQYIIGEWDFLDYTFILKPPVLIPRPETEELVLFAEKDIRGAGMKFLEIGSGSGCVSISLLKRHETISGVAVDMSSEACSLTTLNAGKLGVSNRLEIHRHEILANSASNELFKGVSFDLIVSNPPYIPTADMQHLPDEISKFEDSAALHGGSDGLDVVRNILKFSSELLKPNGVLWMELDRTHPSQIQHVLRQLKLDGEFGDLRTEIDFMKCPRFCRLVKLTPPNT
ncbi:MTRF1L release factor glutamine methyltransferase-like [Tubulanus polymorphus]|uniref:MTRF1L release factor glutamine methyltransferase-like n=1 Tax=Tubulanus polymorphus TaxID=672921 RepID=UPI003DA30EAE